MKEHAKRYIKYGISVIPLQPKEKLPLVQWREYSSRLATEEEIEKWWTDNPEANIGIVTGKISGLTVVDFDVKNGLSPKYSRFPTTKTIKTPSGGFHLYYKYFPGIKTVSDVFKDSSGIDIRNDGGYVVAPPSGTQKGTYSCISGPIKVNQFPEDLFGFEIEAQKQKTEINTLVSVTTGNRNDSMTKLVGKLLKTTRREKWDSDIWPIVNQINKTYSPPLEEEELKTIYNSICSKEIVSINSNGQDEEVLEAVKEFANDPDILNKLDDPNVKNAFLHGLSMYQGDDKIISSKEILERIAQEGEREKFFTGWPELDAIIGGFTPGELIVVSAPTKNGKTAWCMELTNRMKALAPVWFPYEEGATELVHKFVERKEDVPLFYTPSAMIDNHLNWLEKRVLESLVKHKTRIAFIDQLDFLIGGKTNNLGLEINTVLKGLKQIATKWRVVIVLMAHITKLDPELPPTQNDLRDSGQIANKCDTLIMLWRRAKRESKILRVSNEVTISVALNRRTGRTGISKFIFRDNHYFEEDWDDSVPIEKEEYKGGRTPL
jgi:hypothetical protein